jgi:hypothetical protein
MWASVTVSVEKHAARPHSAFAGGETHFCMVEKV